MKRHNKTYKKQPTKRVKKLKEKNKLIAITLILFAALALSDFLIFSKLNKVEHTQEKMVTTQQEIKQEVAEVKVDVVKTKTTYFDNEVQLLLASEQACKSVGMGDSCVNDLMGIAYTETRSFDYNAVGDKGKSYGAFQIHLGYHPDITIAQATDPYWAAKWTIKRMIAYGYPVYRSVAIQRHNGTPNTPATKAYLNTVNYYVNMK